MSNTTKPDYAGELLNRIDGHAEKITPAERQVFLREQLEKWVANFDRWQRMIDADEDFERVFGHATAGDFHLVLSGLSFRITRAAETTS